MEDVRHLIRQSPPVDVAKPYEPSSLRGKTIVITGGANGLGAHMARHWAHHGAHVVIGDIATAAGEELVASLRAAHPTGVFAFQHCDVTSWDAQVSLFETAVRVSPHGGIDIVVPNAGIFLPGQAMKFENPRLVDGKLAQPNTATVNVNIMGVLFTTHLAIHHLPRNSQPDRCILLPQYTMTKHAILGLFRTLRGTAFLKGIRVNMIAPYFISHTKMLKPVAEAMFLAGSAGTARIPDVVDAATRLIADESIAGRGLVVGPPLKTRGIEGAERDMRMIVGDEEGDGEGRTIWEFYGEDYEEVDTFSHRYISLMNGMARARGVWRWLVDLWSIWRRK